MLMVSSRLKQLKEKLQAQRQYLSDLEKNIDDIAKQGGGEQN